MIYISICVTLLTMLAAVHFMARVKSENLGLMAKLITWTVLLAATAILICQVARGIHIMRSGSDHCASGETCLSETNCHEGMMIHKEMKMMHGGSCEGMMENCCMGEKCNKSGACGGACKESMECCKPGMGCCEGDGCKGTGDCGGKCQSKMDCCMDGKSGGMSECHHGMHNGDSVVIEKKVIVK